MLLRNPALVIKFNHLRQRLDTSYWREMNAFDDIYEVYDNGPADLPWIVNDGPHDLPTIIDTGKP